MNKEKFWKIIGTHLIEGDRIFGTRLFNPFIKILQLLIMLYLQTKFYKNYSNIGKWENKLVANTFAPPVGSRPQYRALKNLIKSHLYTHPFPLAMTFAVTYRCQCNCSHCSAGNHTRKKVPELTTEEAKQLIDASQDLGITILAFTGGEPLLRKDIFELISYVDKKKTMPIMFTNGEFLTKENVQKLADARLYSLFLSIDSPFPEEHDEMRGVDGLFEKAFNGLKEAKSKGILVGLSSYASKTNTKKKYYKQLHALAKKNALQNLILFDCVPTGNLLKDEAELLTSDQREEIYEFSSELFRKKIVPPLSSQAWQTSEESFLSGIGCLAANIQYYVSAYGDVAPCDFTPLSFGNIRNEPLKLIWQRMVNHPAYNHRSPYCRMQNRRFRKLYIDPILDDVILPYSIKNLPSVDYR